MIDSPQGLWLPPRVTTLFVAASDSLDRSRAQADYICDGTADEVEINAALNALPASGGIVALSEGTFYISSPIIIPNNDIALQGEGISTFIDGDGLATTEHGIVISGMTNVTIRNLSIQTQNGGGKTCHCIFIEDGASIFGIYSVIIIASDSDGIHIEGTTITDGIIKDCFIQSSDDNGIYCGMDPTNFMIRLRVLDNFIINCGIDGIQIGDTVPSCLISNNYCSNNTRHGINAAGQWSNIIGNTSVVNDQHGININAADIKVSGNYCYINSWGTPGTYHGINLTANADRCVVNDNNSSGDGASQEDGIHLEDGANEAQITGNFCYLGMGSGIALIANNDTCLIVGNVCNSFDDYGIEIAAASCGQNLVKENNLYGNTLGAILDNGTQTGLPWHFEPVPNPNSFIGTHPATVLTDGLAVVDRIEVFLPLEFQELVRASIVLVPGGSGNLRRQVATNWGELGSGEIYNSDSGAIAAGQVAVTLNHVELLDISAAFVGVGALGPGDVIGIEFTRHGNNANDTVNADCYLIGVRIQYV